MVESLEKLGKRYDEALAFVAQKLNAIGYIGTQRLAINRKLK